MKLQVLVAAVDQDVNTLAQRMHLESDAIIINQCDAPAYQEYLHEGRLIRCFSMEGRGVGRSRNEALSHASGEICLFGDEDIVYYPGYEQKVLAAFEDNPQADLITFNFKVDPSRATYYNQKKHRIRWYNYGRYPTYAVAARTAALQQSGVRFSLLFGGGARYSNGEDSLFLHDCLKRKLRIYAETDEIGEEVYRPSTWFCGYNEKFFTDRGVLYHFLYGPLAKPFALRFLYAHAEEMLKEISFWEAYGMMRSGIAEGKARDTDAEDMTEDDDVEGDTEDNKEESRGM